MINKLTKKILKSLADGQNVLITGPLHAGKTTLFNCVLTKLNNCTVIQTKKVDDVVMAYYNGQSAKIGYRTGQTMQSIDTGLDFLTMAAAEFIKGEQILLAIDEIGFLEARCDEYLNLIVQSAKQKSLIAVLRQDRHAFIERMAQLEPYVLIELTGEHKQI